MNKNQYKTIIQKAKSFDELEALKENFLNECSVQYNKIAVANMLGQITNFGDAKAMFESTIPMLLKTKGGKKLINKFASIVKENKSLKTLYALHEGLNRSESADAKKNYITEALTITKPISTDMYMSGVKNVVSLVAEAFKLLGDNIVLQTVKHDNKSQMLGESLVYLATTKKNIKNLNEYITHMNRVSENITESENCTYNIDATLEELVSEMKEKTSSNTVDSIFETDNKEKSFATAKKVCLEMIASQKSTATDNDIYNKLNEMEAKLSKKNYNFDSYTKDMLYMTELQEVLK
jgi:hypothetical protein